MVGRRGYFFVVDAALASIVLFFGIFLLYSMHIEQPESTQPLTTAEDFITLLNYQQLSESTNTYYVQTLLPNRLVLYPDVTPLEEIGYLLIEYNRTGNVTYKEHAYNFTVSLVDEAIDPQYGVALYYSGTLVYNRTIPQNNYLISRPLFIYVRYNLTTLYGPVPGEVQVWQ
jgi:hypothetical protein